MKEFKEEQIFPKISGHPRDLKKIFKYADQQLKCFIGLQCI